MLINGKSQKFLKHKTLHDTLQHCIQTMCIYRILKKGHAPVIKTKYLINFLVNILQLYLLVMMTAMLLLVSSCIPLGWGLGSMFHCLHTLSLVVME